MFPFLEVRKRKSKRNTPKPWKCQKDGHSTFELAAYLADNMTRAWPSEGQLARGGPGTTSLNLWLLRSMGDGSWMGSKCQNWGQEREDAIIDCGLVMDFTDGAEAGTLRLVACQYQLKCSGNEQPSPEFGRIHQCSSCYLETSLTPPASQASSSPKTINWKSCNTTQRPAMFTTDIERKSHLSCSSLFFLPNIREPTTRRERTGSQEGSPCLPSPPPIFVCLQREKGP